MRTTASGAAVRLPHSSPATTEARTIECWGTCPKRRQSLPHLADRGRCNHAVTTLVTTLVTKAVTTLSPPRCHHAVTTLSPRCHHAVTTLSPRCHHAGHNAVTTVTPAVTTLVTSLSQCWSQRWSTTLSQRWFTTLSQQRSQKWFQRCYGPRRDRRHRHRVVLQTWRFDLLPRDER